jgi:hypothetical protein
MDEAKFPLGQTVITRTACAVLTAEEVAVEKCGMISHWSANLIFVERTGSGGPGDPDTNFDPAPSLSWTLNYVPHVEDPSNLGYRVWRFFNPDIGLNVAALDFEDQGVQVGVGGHLTLFNDLLQAGYGVNPNADRDQGYFFFGIGIFEAFNRLGGLPRGWPLDR